MDETYLEINVGEAGGMGPGPGPGGDMPPPPPPHIRDRLSKEELDTIKYISESAYEFDDEYDLKFIQWMTKKGKSYKTVADYLYRLE